MGGEGLLSASLWGARGVCEDDMAKSYFWEPADGGALLASMSILFCAVTHSA